MTYTLSMRDDGGSDYDVDFDGMPTQAEIRDAATDWVQGGEWGDDGAAVDVRYTITDEDGETVDSDFITVDVEPNHDALIRAAGGDVNCDHEWTAEGEGGLDDNPGVWSTGGTSMLFVRHCRHCGLIRKEHYCGSQRNPGEHDTFEYEMPEAWCSECERADCVCPRISYRVYRAPDGCCQEYVGEYKSLNEAKDAAEAEPAGLQQSLWETARAAGQCGGMTAPSDGEEDDEPCSWHGSEGGYCVVRVVRRQSR